MLLHRHHLLVLAAFAIIAGPAAAHIGIEVPNGGEVFTAGEVVTIRWHIYIPHALENWDLWYAIDAPTFHELCTDEAGYDWIPIEMDVPATCTDAGGSCSTPGGCQMEYDWTIPDGIDSDSVKVRVRMDNTSIDYYDVSNNPFSIRSSSDVRESLAHHGFVLEQSSPNPFRPTTTIPFVLADQTEHLLLQVFDPTGRVVRTLLKGSKGLGYHAVLWNGADDQGKRLPSGTYFYRLSVGGVSETRKVELID